MRVLVCPTAFKESLSANRLADAIGEGVLRVASDSTLHRMPVSDGGPGLLDAIAESEGGEVRTFRVSGPLGKPVSARTLWSSPTDVVIETAEACGLHLIPPAARDPMRADTRGVGELVIRCLDAGATDLSLGLGGSATVDGGTGLGRVFGYRFAGPDGVELGAGGGFLADLQRIEPGAPPAPGVTFTAMADVSAPLSGPGGAARVFGHQKGAGPADVEVLEEGLARLSDRLRCDLGYDIAQRPGTGAAGGLGAGCVAFLGAALESGSEWVLHRVGFDAAIDAADLVITGEGEWDATSGLGKITHEILRRARSRGVPALLVCGAINAPAPPGATIIGGDGAWLEPEDVTRLVAAAFE